MSSTQVKHRHKAHSKHTHQLELYLRVKGWYLRGDAGQWQQDQGSWSPPVSMLATTIITHIMTAPRITFLFAAPRSGRPRFDGLLHRLAWRRPRPSKRCLNMLYWALQCVHFTDPLSFTTKVLRALPSNGCFGPASAAARTAHRLLGNGVPLKQNRYWL